mmetsp:Transcript_120341/g.212801  ORF Transcript_120341/g.212801 Transcript_120341/m.212801 type:complete len:228 (-) Transcript_120341:3936-4619(-)
MRNLCHCRLIPSFEGGDGLPSVPVGVQAFWLSEGPLNDVIYSDDLSSVYVSKAASCCRYSALRRANNQCVQPVALRHSVRIAREVWLRVVAGIHLLLLCLALRVLGLFCHLLTPLDSLCSFTLFLLLHLLLLDFSHSTFYPFPGAIARQSNSRFCKIRNKTIIHTQGTLFLKVFLIKIHTVYFNWVVSGIHKREVTGKTSCVGHHRTEIVAQSRCNSQLQDVSAASD